ncbi:MAG: hypothetical protein D6729_16755 [Deltaproteobacteria bacterium]|nr:MAG: hypothetical protein D6729_16755 [Deltaproteobacteria bacterium]
MNPWRLIPPLSLALLAVGCPTTPEPGCSDAQIEVDGGCVTRVCTPGSLGCDGARIRRCADDGMGWEDPRWCGTDTVCFEGQCMLPYRCADADPPCCVSSWDCGSADNMVRKQACPECRFIAEEAYCSGGRCEPEPTLRVGFNVYADADGLAPAEADAVQSAVITVYRGIDAVGDTVDCARLLTPDETGTSPHERQAPWLTATVSRALSVSRTTGRDVFGAYLSPVPVGSGQVLVFTVYDEAAGGGAALGRGCLEDLDPQEGVDVSLDLVRLGGG